LLVNADNFSAAKKSMIFKKKLNKTQ